ncbi:MAG: AbrB family transcriptional regulator [Acidithiobacillus sp.]
MGIADLGVILARVVGNSDLDGYLATAPGALYAAVAFSMAAHGNVLFVLGAHRIRLLMMLLIMPPLAQIISTSKIRLNLFPSIRPDGILW